jgi:hypothetical protein
MSQITDEQADLLAEHAIYVQGGYSTPEIERQRANADIASGSVYHWEKIAAEVREAKSQAPAAEPKPVQITPQADTRLEQLHALYEAKKAAKDQAETELKAVTDAIKREMYELLPEGATSATITGQAGPTLAMTYVETWRFDSKRFKADDPHTYVRYANKSGTWKLEKAKGQS